MSLNKALSKFNLSDMMDHRTSGEIVTDSGQKWELRDHMCAARTKGPSLLLLSDLDSSFLI